MPKPVKGLGKVQAGFGGFRGTERRGVGVGRRFQTSEPERDDEQGEQEEREACDARRRDEQQGPDRVQAQAAQDARLVAFPFHEQAGGDRHDEIGPEIRGLNEPGLGLGHVERHLKMLVQHVDEPVGQAPHEKQRGDEDKRLAVLRTGYLAHGAPPSAGRQGTVEMRVAAVHHDPLARGMRRQRRKQEHRHIRQFLHRGHPVPQGDVADDGFQLFRRAGECVHPPFIERGPDLSGDHGVHPDAVLEIGCGPLARQGQNAPLGGGVAAGPALPRERGLGADVKDAPLALFQFPDAVVRHRVVMDEVALKRNPECLQFIF